jgi:tRNA threonylcarbamoyl adenosine modification protein (Sua5/YciO/YrdC/YwlC family)
MSAIRLSLHPVTPQVRWMKQILECLTKDGLAIYPTDSGYSLGCDARSKKAVQKLYRAKRSMNKYLAALMVRDFSAASDFAQIDNAAFRIMKRLAPGPYTFIVPSTVKGRRLLDVNRPEIGIRMPKCVFGDALYALSPDFVLLTTAAQLRDEDHFSDPDKIEEMYRNEVDIIAEIGPVPIAPTTVLNLVTGEPELLREGQGNWPL